MSKAAARVTELNALLELRHALIEFCDVTKSALGEAQSKVQRAMWWVEQEQPAYWNNQKRKRAAQLQQAQAELFRAQLQSNDDRGSAALERKAVDKAKARLDEAETRLASLKRWRPMLEREMIMLRAQCQQLATAVDADLPKAQAGLEKMTRSLEQYVKLAPPEAASETPGQAAATPTSENSEDGDERPGDLP